MGKAAWALQTYEMTDEAAQQAVADLLAAHVALAVEARTDDGRALLSVEFADPADALSVYEMVMMADPNAELIHSTVGPAAAEGDKAPV